MSDMKKDALEYRSADPGATFQVARKFAEETYADQEQIKAFLRAWFDFDTQVRESQSTVDRCWPESKGY